MSFTQSDEEEPQRKCEFCDTTYADEATSVCKQCKAFFCSACLRDFHSRGAYSKHEVVPIEDYLSKKDDNTCAEHQEPIKLYCQPCDIFICLECKALGSHTSHGVVSIKKTAMELKRSLKNLLDEVAGPKIDDKSENNSVTAHSDVNEDAIETGVQMLLEKTQEAFSKHEDDIDEKIEEYKKKLEKAKVYLYEKSKKEKLFVEKTLKAALESLQGDGSSTSTSLLEDQKELVTGLLVIRSRLVQGGDEDEGVDYRPENTSNLEALKVTIVQENSYDNCIWQTPKGTTLAFCPAETEDTTYMAGLERKLTGCLQTITAMKAYNTLSQEELRLDDYILGRKFGQGRTIVIYGDSSDEQMQESPSRQYVSSFTSKQWPWPFFPRNPFGSGFSFGPKAPQTTQSGFGLFRAAQSTTASSGLFGAAPATTASSGLFGAAPATNVSGGLFGAAQTTTASSGLFGAAPATTAGSGLFGAAPATTVSSGLFGAAPATTISGGFGAAPATTASSGLFGAAPATTAGSGLFGAAPATTASSGLFGAAPATTVSSGLFGAAPATTASSGLFGAASATNVSSGFGAAPATTASSGLFGAATATTASSGLFGAAPATSASSGLFGAAPATNVSGGFFRAVPTTTASSGLFGATTVSSGLFGAVPATNVWGGFGAAPATNVKGGLFGNSVKTAQETTGLAGGVVTSAQTMQGGFSFGGKTTQATSGFTFGSPTTQTTIATPCGLTLGSPPTNLCTSSSGPSNTTTQARSFGFTFGSPTTQTTTATRPTPGGLTLGSPPTNLCTASSGQSNTTTQARPFGFTFGSPTTQTTTVSGGLLGGSTQTTVTASQSALGSLTPSTRAADFSGISFGPPRTRTSPASPARSSSSSSSSPDRSAAVEAKTELPSIGNLSLSESAESITQSSNSEQNSATKSSAFSLAPARLAVTPSKPTESTSNDTQR